MDTLEHPQSYYVATARPFPQLPELQGETEADVAVIGGGYTGLSAPRSTWRSAAIRWC